MSRATLLVLALLLPALVAAPQAGAATDFGPGSAGAAASPSTVFATGGNTQGQLGDLSLTDRVDFGPVTGLASATSVSSGLFHSTALLSNGTVRTWGWNNTGQLGNGGTTTSMAPVQVSGLTKLSRWPPAHSTTWP